METETFGSFLKKCRLTRGYTLRDLAYMIGTSPYYISLIENGKKTNPDIKIFGRLYEKLSLSKYEMEFLLYLHAKENNCVCCDLADFIMQNEDVIEHLRNERDKPNAHPNWDDFIKKITGK